MRKLELELEQAQAELSVEKRARLATLQELTATKKVQSTLEELSKRLQDRVAEERARAEASDAASAEMKSKYNEIFEDITKKIEDEAASTEARFKESQFVKRKLLAFMHKYEVREEQYANEAKAAAIELELANVKVAQAQEEAKMAQARFMEVMQKYVVLEKVEAQQAKQLELYESRFKELSTVVTQSNNLLKQYQTEHKANVKALNKAPRENQKIKEAELKATIKALELSKDIEEYKRKVSTLENLCRALQARSAAAPAAATDKAADEAADAAAPPAADQ